MKGTLLLRKHHIIHIYDKDNCVGSISAISNNIEVSIEDFLDNTIKLFSCKDDVAFFQVFGTKYKIEEL